MNPVLGPIADVKAWTPPVDNRAKWPWEHSGRRRSRRAGLTRRQN